MIDRVRADVLVELTPLEPLTGQPALDHVRRALRRGMDVVTANKGPIAHASAHAASNHRAQRRPPAPRVDGDGRRTRVQPQGPQPPGDAGHRFSRSSQLDDDPCSVADGAGGDSRRSDRRGAGPRNRRGGPALRHRWLGRRRQGERALECDPRTLHPADRGAPARCRKRHAGRRASGRKREGAADPARDPRRRRRSRRPRLRGSRGAGARRSAEPWPARTPSWFWRPSCSERSVSSREGVESTRPPSACCRTCCAWSRSRDDDARAAGESSRRLSTLRRTPSSTRSATCSRSSSSAGSPSASSRSSISAGAAGASGTLSRRAGMGEVAAGEAVSSLPEVAGIHRVAVRQLLAGRRRDRRCS